MEAMRKEGGDQWLALFNAEGDQQQQFSKVWSSVLLWSCDDDRMSLQLSPRKKRKSKASKKKMKDRNSWEKLVVILA